MFLFAPILTLVISFMYDHMAVRPNGQACSCVQSHFHIHSKRLVASDGLLYLVALLQSDLCNRRLSRQ